MIELIQIGRRKTQSWDLPDLTYKNNTRKKLSKAMFMCDALLDANNTALDLICKEDITVYWNGGNNVEDLVVYSGDCGSEFGHGTITLHQKYIWKATGFIQIGPQPNTDCDDWKMLDGIIRPEQLHYPWTPVIRFTRSGTHIIKKGSVLGSVRLLPDSFDIRARPEYRYVDGELDLLIREKRMYDERQAGNKPTTHYRNSLRRSHNIRYANFELAYANNWISMKKRHDPAYLEECYDAIRDDVIKESYLERSVELGQIRTNTNAKWLTVINITSRPLLFMNHLEDPIGTGGIICIKNPKPKTLPSFDNNTINIYWT